MVFLRWSHKQSVLVMAWPLVQIWFGWWKSSWCCAFQSPTLLERYWIIFLVTMTQHCFGVHNLRHCFQSMGRRWAQWRKLKQFARWRLCSGCLWHANFGCQKFAGLMFAKPLAWWQQCEKCWVVWHQAGKGGDLTHDETTIIQGALDLTEKVWT